MSVTTGGSSKGARPYRDIATFVALLALLALALIGVARLGASPAAAEAAEAVPEGRLFEILAPKDDALMRGDRLQVRLLLEQDVSLQSARLNGKSVKHLFSSSSGTGQLATLSAARLGKLLPLGRNFLRFVVRRGGRGGEKDYETVVFTRVQRTPELVRRLKVEPRRFGAATVRLEPSTLDAQLRVTLNETNVSRQFREGTPLTRVVELGASDGLKHGRNRLLVRAHTHHGELEKLRRQFRISKRLPIAGAGRDREIFAGDAVRLNAGSSRAVPNGAPGSGQAAISHRWKLTERPQGSDARVIGTGKRRPEVSTDLPGTYTAQLRTAKEPTGSADATGARSSLDEVQVTVNAQPLVAVSTLATVGGKSGMSVDVTRECSGAKAATGPPCFYPNPGADTDLQVVVLDRRTLELKSNRAYKPDDLSAFLAAMKGLETPVQGGCPGYDTTKLVLIALRSGSISDTKRFAQGLSIFNTDDAAKTAGCPKELGGLTAAPFSLAAVPGTLAGKAWTNAGLQINGPGGAPGVKGSLDGFLKLTADDPAEVASTRAFTYPTAIGYDTRRVSDGTTEFAIGGDAVPVLPASEPAASHGFSVFSFDPVNPEGSLKREAFINYDENRWADLLDLTLASLAQSGKGVGITSTGQVQPKQPPFEPRASAFESVLLRLEKLGANADIFARAVNQNFAAKADPRGTYSMIAANGIAYQSSSVMAESVPNAAQARSLPVNDGRLTGTIQRAAGGRVYPSDGDPSGIQQETGLLPIVYGSQVDWPLTPEPESGAASCQETAFAYIAQAAFDYGSDPLWGQGATSQACEGRDHTGTAGVRRADTLDADACAAADPAANGAAGANVRSTSMELRSAYQSLDTTFSQAKILTLTRPAGAPFTDDDLICARNQMIDELAARDQVMKFMEILQKPQNNLQRDTVVQLGQIAENVKTQALAKISMQLMAEDAVSTPSFWANFAFGAGNAIGTIGAFFAPEESTVKRALQFLAVASKGGQSIFNAIGGPPGNPVLLTNEYILLAAQLDQKAEEVERQVNDVLAAQQNGVLQTEGIMLSDPRRMAAVNTKAKGEWQVTAAGLQAAQDAYAYRVGQLAYLEFWPNVYSAYRFSYSQACQVGPRASKVAKQQYMCFDRSKGWQPVNPTAGAFTAKSLASAGPAFCAGIFTIGRPSGPWVSQFFKAADPGAPVGLGQGTEYHPQAGVVTEGRTPPYEVYVMAQRGNPSSLADKGVVAPLFEQPQKRGDPGAGFYAPVFWQQNLDLSRRVTCLSGGRPPAGSGLRSRPPTLSSRSLGAGAGIYTDTQPTDIWPTPPG